MTTAIRCTLLAVLMGSLSAAFAAVALADESPNRVVHYTDLDLTRSTGVEMLYTRIKVAAREVCEPEGTRGLAFVAAANQCMEQAIANAIARVGAPALTNYYLVKTGKSMIVARQ